MGIVRMGIADSSIHVARMGRVPANRADTIRLSIMIDRFQFFTDCLRSIFSSSYL